MIVLPPRSQLLLLLSAAWFLTVSAAEKPSLEVEIRNIRTGPGEIMVALFSKKEGFPSDEKKALRTGVARRSGTSAVIRFDDLPSGQYAVSVFHDANSNKLLDTGLMGIPKEGYGISNNAFNRFGPPDYEDCSFNLTQSRKIAIDLKY